MPAKVPVDHGDPCLGCDDGLGNPRFTAIPELIITIGIVRPIAEWAMPKAWIISWDPSFNTSIVWI
jgi:hypothetical protein